jgi:transcription initiation factor TFIID subunit TAF12
MHAMFYEEDYDVDNRKAMTSSCMPENPLNDRVSSENPQKLLIQASNPSVSTSHKNDGL